MKYEMIRCSVRRHFILRSSFINFSVAFFLAVLARSANAQSYLSTTAELAIDFYQHILSPIRHPASKCQFEPSCSQFAKEAFEQYGPVVGSVMAADRLMRCGTSANTDEYPFNGDLFIDPPEKSYLFGEGGIWKLGIIEPRQSPNPDTLVPSSFKFARSLYGEQDFDYSIIELKRLQAESGDSSNSNYANALISVDYLRLNSIHKARAAIDKVRSNLLSPTRHINAFILDYLIADEEGLDAWNASRCRDAIIDTSLRTSPNLLPALRAYSLTKAEEYDSARSFATPLGASVFVTKVADAGDKSPGLAAIMSALIPGSGYVYSGRFGEGVSALTFNALLGWGIYSLFKNHDTGSGILLSSITLPFYLGNIAGSYNAAESFNAREQQIALGSLRQALKIDFYFSTDFLDNCWE